MISESEKIENHFLQSTSFSPFTYHIYPISEPQNKIYDKYIKVNKETRLRYMRFGSYGLPLRGMRLRSSKMLAFLRMTAVQLGNLGDNLAKPVDVSNHRCKCHGERIENKIVRIYEKQRNVKVIRCVKHIVNGGIPWIVAAADGFVSKNNQIYGVEVKFIGDKRDTSRKFISRGLFVKRDNFWVVNPNSSGYFQMQICMLVTNLREWELVLYWRKDKTVQVFNIKRDDSLLNAIVPLLANRYFEFILPKLAEALTKLDIMTD